MSGTQNAIAALAAVLAAAIPAPVMRASAYPERVPAGGLVLVRDGRLTNATAMLSPLRYEHEHEAEVEVLVAATIDEPRARALLDALTVSIGAAIALNRTLGGAVEYAEPGAAEIEIAEIGESAAVRAARIPVTLTFVTDDTPLS